MAESRMLLVCSWRSSVRCCGRDLLRELSAGAMNSRPAFERRHRVNVKRFLLLLVILVISALVYFLVVFRPSSEILLDSSKLIDEGAESLAKGKTKDALEAVHKCQQNLGGLEDWYVFPAHKRAARALMTRVNELEKASNKRNELYKTTIKDVTQQLAAGNYQLADTLIGNAIKLIPASDTNLAGFQKLAERIRYQDFAAAQTEVDGVREGIAENTNVSSTLVDFAALIAQGKKDNFSKQQELAERVGSLIRGTHNRIQRYPQIKGRVMVWDYTQKGVEDAYVLLNDNLRASPHDKVVTIVGIRKRWDKTIGYYSISNQPAYQEIMEVGLVYWPEMKSPGFAVIEGGKPPSMRPVTYSPGRGSSVSIMEWIQGNISATNN
jgi:hypothetical protein